jgi:hypothetical protein
MLSRAQMLALAGGIQQHRRGDPNAGLVLGTEGNFYGTTVSEEDCGVRLKVAGQRRLGGCQQPLSSD